MHRYKHPLPTRYFCKHFHRRVKLTTSVRKIMLIYSNSIGEMSSHGWVCTTNVWIFFFDVKLYIYGIYIYRKYSNWLDDPPQKIKINDGDPSKSSKNMSMTLPSPVPAHPPWLLTYSPLSILPWSARIITYLPAWWYNIKITIYYREKSDTLFHRDELEIFYFLSDEGARKIIVREFIEVK